MVSALGGELRVYELREFKPHQAAEILGHSPGGIKLSTRCPCSVSSREENNETARLTKWLPLYTSRLHTTGRGHPRGSPKKAYRCYRL